MDSVEAFSQLPDDHAEPNTDSYQAILALAPADLYDGFQTASEMFVTYTIEVTNLLEVSAALLVRHPISNSQADGAAYTCSDSALPGVQCVLYAEVPRSAESPCHPPGDHHHRLPGVHRDAVQVGLCTHCTARTRLIHATFCAWMRCRAEHATGLPRPKGCAEHTGPPSTILPAAGHMWRVCTWRARPLPAC